MAWLARDGAKLLNVQALAYGLHGWYPNDLMVGVDAWIRAHYRFRPESEELVRTVARMVEEIQTLGFFEGDCDDAATFYASILYTLGIPVRFVAIRYDRFNPEFQHVFVEYDGHTFVEYENEVSERWLRLDPTVAPGTVHRELERMIQDV